MITHHSPDNRTPLLLRLVTGWHALLVLAGLAGLFWVWLSAASPSASWLKILLTIALGLVILASGAAVPLILRHDHRGRVFSLVLNYLGFLVCLLGSLHLLNVFVGIDSLADTFGRGVPYLAVMFVGYLISSFGDRYEAYPQRQALFHNIGRYLALAAFAGFLLAVGLISGLLATLARLSNLVILAFLLSSLLFGLMIWAMWRQPTALAMGANNAHHEMLSGFLFLSPNLLGFLLFFAGPLIFSFIVSFTNWDAFGTRDWIGLSNYAKIFNVIIQPLPAADTPVTQALNVDVYDEVARFGIFGRHFILGAEDKLFWLALRNTFAFCLMAVPLSIIPALFLANLLNSKLPGMKFFRAVYFLPSIAAVVGVALIWQWLYNAAVGYINYGITSSIELINAIFGLSLVDPQTRWLSDTSTALLAVVIMSAWQWLGFNTVLFLAGLQNIPGELYEAATVDGAGSWSKFWKVTVPLLAPTTFFVVTTTVIQALQLFEQVYVLIPTEPPGGPNNSTLTLVLYLYQKGFQRFEQGYASAVAWVLFAVIFTVTLYQYRRSRSTSAITG